MAHLGLLEHESEPNVAANRPSRALQQQCTVSDTSSDCVDKSLKQVLSASLPLRWSLTHIEAGAPVAAGVGRVVARLVHRRRERPSARETRQRWPHQTRDLQIPTSHPRSEFSRLSTDPGQRSRGSGPGRRPGVGCCGRPARSGRSARTGLGRSSSGTAPASTSAPMKHHPSATPRSHSTHMHCSDHFTHIHRSRIQHCNQFAHASASGPAVKREAADRCAGARADLPAADLARLVVKHAVLHVGVNLHGHRDLLCDDLFHRHLHLTQRRGRLSACLVD
eukprot:3937742-Rhodomonas_salina.2